VKKSSIIGLALFAALALTAVAGAATASASQFRAQQYPATITGTQGTPQKLVLNGATTIKCSNPTATATATTASSTLDLTPTYSGCTLGGLAATITPNGCHLNYTSTSESAPFTGTFGVNCSAGSAIEIKQGTCVISIASQSGVSGMEFTNSGSGNSRTVTATYGLTTLAYSGGAGCPGSLVGSFSNGTMTGTSVLKGSVGLRQVGVYVGNSQVETGPQFQSSNYPAIVDIVAANSFLWNFNGTTMKCNTFVGSSNLAAASPELRQSVNFAGCTAGGIEFKIAMNGCSFVNYVEGGSFTGGTEIACSAGQEMTLTWGSCVIGFPSQNRPGSVAYTNGELGGMKQVAVSLNASGVKYNGGAGCATNLIGAHENATLSDSWTLRSFLDAGGSKGAQTHLWIA
jgi:hypothetical protein